MKNNRTDFFGALPAILILILLWAIFVLPTLLSLMGH